MKKIDPKDLNMQGTNLSGWFFHSKKETISAKSYEEARIKQFLQHISRQIYFYLTSIEKYNPVEIEVLYMAHNNSFYVAENKQNYPTKLNALKGKSIKNILCHDYSEHIATKYKELAKRTAMKFKNIEARLKTFNEDERDVIEKIWNLVNNKFVSSSEINEALHYNNKPILFSYAPKHRDKEKTPMSQAHAELRLIPLVRSLIGRKNIDDKRAWLYGKKRPCLTCYSELSTVKGQTFYFSKRNGLFYSGQQYYLSQEGLSTLLKNLDDGMMYVSEIGSWTNTESLSDSSTDSKEICDDASESDSDESGKKPGAPSRRSY